MEWADVINQLFLITNPKGYSFEEVEKAKALYGRLPSTLEQFYLQLGRSDELIHIQDELILPDRYPAFANYNYLVFFNENQGVCQAGISLEDIKMDDPPVYVGYDNTEWNKTSDSLSSFLIAMFGYQASLCLHYSPTEFYWITESDFEVIKQHFAKQPCSLQNWLNFKVDLYANSPNERLALMNIGDVLEMIYAANNQQDFVKMQNILKNVGEAM